ncbi:hypothetical protein BKP35_15020 [Anaerobacillus arseniciselenatis]|uniref:Myb-like domain-containing protein n=1 Tax=Anaerobacillus arseniciselenatis TaxID=85682 RepID=A0A1S2LE53_9BACI|nr:RsfA family transcriptional regulator [Anaerobacillus arseniciselenatis]OIJ09795.1 hypothetical protein BKP35_15020 [Anaerobacillus arseniciselenatis]
MSIVRQDAWTNDEDLVLAEVVLRHIREGSTQLSAFEEVGERLSRTAAACGFRWNSCVRKKYDAAIAIAKKQRKNLKKTKLSDENKDCDVEVSEEIAEVIKPKLEVEKNEMPTENVSIDDVINFLVAKKHLLSSNDDIESENRELKQTVADLSNEKEKLQKALLDLQENYETMKQDYKLLIDIMDRAKQMSVTKN